MKTHAPEGFLFSKCKIKQLVYAGLCHNVVLEMIEKAGG